MSVLTETIVYITSSSSFEGNTDCDSQECLSGPCNDSNPRVSDNVTMGMSICMHTYKYTHTHTYIHIYLYKFSVSSTIKELWVLSCLFFHTDLSIALTSVPWIALPQNTRQLALWKLWSGHTACTPDNRTASYILLPFPLDVWHLKSWGKLELN